MGDQAEAMKYSAAFISAVELGKKQIPEGYIDAFGRWLGLKPEELRLLQNAAEASHSLVSLRPDTPERSAFSMHLARRLNELTTDQIVALRKIIEEAA
jgi:hypothetical protein